MANAKQRPFDGVRPNHHLKEWRLFRKMSTRALGEAAGMSHVAVVRLENGQVQLNEETLARLARALNTDAASILTRNPEETEEIWAVWRDLSNDDRELLLEVARARIRARKHPQPKG